MTARARVFSQRGVGFGARMRVYRGIMGFDVLPPDVVGCAIVSDAAVYAAAISDMPTGTAQMSDAAVYEAAIDDDATGVAVVQDAALGVAVVSDEAVYTATVKDEPVDC